MGPGSSSIVLTPSCYGSQCHRCRRCRRYLCCRQLVELRLELVQWCGGQQLWVRNVRCRLGRAMNACLPRHWAAAGVVGLISFSSSSIVLTPSCYGSQCHRRRRCRRYLCCRQLVELRLELVRWCGGQQLWVRNVRSRLCRAMNACVPRLGACSGCGWTNLV
jgi:hypothetical protein